MIDIETYRRRIGCFTSRGTRKRQRIWKMNTSQYSDTNMEFAHPKKEYNDNRNRIISINWKIALLLIASITAVSISTNVYISQDSRSGKNRQRPTENSKPAFENFPYESNSEKVAFNNIRNLESKLSRASSHLEFYSKCLTRNVYPGNLEFNQNFNLAFAGDDIKTKMNSTDRKHIMEKMKIAVSC